jgi:hypothetical protein
MKLTKPQREVLERMADGWRPAMNTRNGYFFLGRGKWPDGEIWTPRGRTGATVFKLLKLRLLKLTSRKTLVTKELVLTDAGREAIGKGGSH